MTEFKDIPYQENFKDPNSYMEIARQFALAFDRDGVNVLSVLADQYRMFAIQAIDQNLPEKEWKEYELIAENLSKASDSLHSMLQILDSGSLSHRFISIRKNEGRL